MVVIDGVQDSEEIGDAQSVDTRESWEYTDGGALQRVSRLVEYDVQEQARKWVAEKRSRRASFTSISRSASKRLSRLLKPDV
jgi:hypothetical protein